MLFYEFDTIDSITLGAKKIKDDQLTNIFKIFIARSNNLSFCYDTISSIHAPNSVSSQLLHP